MLNYVLWIGYGVLVTALFAIILALGIVLYTDVKDEWDYKNGK